MDTNRYLQNQNKNQGNDSNMLHQLLLLSLLGSGGSLGGGAGFGPGMLGFGRQGTPSQLPHDYIDSLLYKMEGRHSNKQKIDSMLEMMKQKKFNLPEASNRLMDSGMFGKLLEDRFPLPEESERMRGSKLGGKMLNPLFEKMQSLDLFDRMMNNLSNMID